MLSIMHCVDPWDAYALFLDGTLEYLWDFTVTCQFMGSKYKGYMTAIALRKKIWCKNVWIDLKVIWYGIHACITKAMQKNNLTAILIQAADIIKYICMEAWKPGKEILQWNVDEYFIAGCTTPACLILELLCSQSFSLSLLDWVDT